MSYAVLFVLSLLVEPFRYRSHHYPNARIQFLELRLPESDKCHDFPMIS